MFKDIGGYHMAYREVKEMGRNAWSEKLNYLRIDMTEIKTEGNYQKFNYSKNTHRLHSWNWIFLININVVLKKNRDDLENFSELVSLQNQVKILKLQDNLAKQNFHKDMIKSF